MVWAIRTRMVARRRPSSNRSRVPSTLRGKIQPIKSTGLEAFSVTTSTLRPRVHTPVLTTRLVSSPLSSPSWLLFGTSPQSLITVVAQNGAIVVDSDSHLCVDSAMPSCTRRKRSAYERREIEIVRARSASVGRPRSSLPELQKSSVKRRPAK